MGDPVIKAKQGTRVLVEFDQDWLRDTLTTAHNYELAIHNQDTLAVEYRAKAEGRLRQLETLLATLSNFGR